MGLGLCVPAMRGLTIRWSVGPFPPRALPRFVGNTGRSDFPPPMPTPPVALGVGVHQTPPWRWEDLPGSVRFPSLRADGCGPGGRGSALAWARGRCCLPRRCLRVGVHGVRDFGAGPVPARVSRISAHRIPVSASPRPLPDWPQDSVPAARWLAWSPVGLPALHRESTSPTGKRRLSPAHATSPTRPRGARRVEPLAGRAAGEWGGTLGRH